MEGYPGRLDQAEPLQSIIQHSKLLNRQISVNLDHDSPHSDSCRHWDLGHNRVSPLDSRSRRTLQRFDKFRLLLWFQSSSLTVKAAGNGKECAKLASMATGCSNLASSKT